MVAGFVLALAKLLLVSDLSLAGLAYAGYDDALFVRLGNAISRGRWLGAYDALTLAKGPGYPLFMAGCRVIHLPLFLGQHLLYIGFCATFVWAVQPWLRYRLAGVLLFALLLFNPISFHTGEMSRVVREGIYPALGGLVLASAIGLALRSGGPTRKQWVWSCGMGFWLGLFWITREEGIWILPAVILLLGWAAVMAVRSRDARPVRLAAVIVPVGVCLVIVNSICLVNLIKYGEYTTVEFKSRDFVDAYGALTRIGTGQKPALVPVPRASRELAYRASPTFARLQTYLEGPPSRMWIEASQGVGVKNDIAGGWFMWALRDAAFDSEHFTSARDAMRFYRHVAKEINRACDGGQIPAGPRRSSMVPPFERRYVPALLNSAVQGFKGLLSLDGFTPGARYSGGVEEGLKLFARTTRSEIAPSAPPGERAKFPAHEGTVRYRLREWLGAGYAHAVPVLVVLAALILVIRALHLWRRQPLLLLAAVSVAGVVLLRLAILAWIDVTSFGGMILLYLSPMHPMVLAFIGVGALSLWAGRAERSSDAKARIDGKVRPIPMRS